VEFVKGFQQVLVTAADPTATPELSWDAKFSVSQGEVTRD
jgi:hypothetical protein